MSIRRRQASSTCSTSLMSHSRPCRNRWCDPGGKCWSRRWRNCGSLVNNCRVLRGHAQTGKIASNHKLIIRSTGLRKVHVDALAQFKQVQKEGWANFAPLEASTTPTAARLVRFAKIQAGQRVLDVGCGTGVVALTAARLGAKVTGIDLTPELVAHAKENAAIMKLPVQFQQGDVEALPVPDATFDVVVSQFGHMFAPRPAVAVKEMLRVLKPGGT